MSKPQSIVDAQLEHLLNLVEQNREESCTKIQILAQDKAVKLISKAHSTARNRMHEFNISLRGSIDQQLSSTEARMQTQKRLARQQSDEELLVTGWTLMKTSLEQLWQHTESRTQWIDNLVNLALEKLASPHWQIEHPSDWATGERRTLQELLQNKLGHLPVLKADESISAGLRLCAANSCIDGTINGLMHDKPRIEARMLTSFHKYGNADLG